MAGSEGTTSAAAAQTRGQFPLHRLDDSKSSSPSTARDTPDSLSDPELDAENVVLPGVSDDAVESFRLKSISPHVPEDEDAALLSDDPGAEWDEVDPKESKPFGRQHGRHGSTTTVESFTLYTPDEERAVRRKLDRRLALFLAFLYMLSFLDRSNIGNARVAGLSADLELSSYQFEWLLTAFYLFYICFQWMTLLYRVIPAHIYIALCVLSWGLIASLQSLANSFWLMLILRALLGLGEAAFSPGIPFYLSFFYKREELGLRTGLLIAAAPLATSFASSLAWLITKLGTGGPIAPWRLLFLIEGFPSIVVSIICWAVIPDGPSSVKYLTRRQKKVAELRLRREKTTVASGRQDEKLKGREILQALVDPKCWLTAFMFFNCNVAFSSLPVFLPTIFNEMGYSALSSQALSAPPYLFSFFVVLASAFLSDRWQNRSLFICGHAMMGFLGYGMIAVAGSLRWHILWRYAMIYPAAAGFFSAVTLIITWTVNNQESDSKKGTGVVLLNLVGQCGPILGTRLYPDADAPYYVPGMSICAVAMLLVFGLALALRIMLARENRRLDLRYSRVGQDDLDPAGTGPSAGRRFRFML